MPIESQYLKLFGDCQQELAPRRRANPELASLVQDRSSCTLRLPTQKTSGASLTAMSTEAKPQRQNERLDLLLNLTSSITSSLDLRELLRATSANIRDVVQADAAGVAFFDEGSNKSRIYALDFPDAKGFVKEELVVTPGHALKRAWGSSKAVIVNTNDREELGPEIYDMVIAEGLDTHCLIPLVSRGRPVGLLILARKGQNLFTSEDVDFLTRASMRRPTGRPRL